MTWIPTLITGGLNLLENIFGSSSRRKDKELNLEVWDKQQHWQLEFQRWQQEQQERLQIINHKEQDQRSKLLKQYVEVVENIARTNIELAILTQKTHDERFMLLKDWLIKKQVELGDFRQTIINHLFDNLKKAEQLSESSAARFQRVTLKSAETSFQQIISIEKTTHKEIAKRCEQNGIDYKPLPQLNITDNDFVKKLIM